MPPSWNANMGNCKSKGQEDANCELQRPDTSDQKSNGSHQNHIIQEQVSSTKANTSNLNSPNKKKGFNVKNKFKMSKDTNDAQSTNRTTKDAQSMNRTTNDAVIDSTRAEVSGLLEGISNFQGTSQNDKDYRYLDEMLTRCILKLDTIECNSSRDRTNRKEAIRGVNEAISILERKLEINNDIKDVGINLRTD
uniref:BAG domain-containing protein Samui n=1 Tax=Aceria tosichella TaxID=561515 RepID=A0A6G1S5X4_9ACAR